MQKYPFFKGKTEELTSFDDNKFFVINNSVLKKNIFEFEDACEYYKCDPVIYAYFIQFIANILYKAPEIYIDPNNKFSD